MEDVNSKIIGSLVQPQTLLANLNGPAVPTTGLVGLIDVIAIVGAPGNGTGTLSLQLQTSADGATNWVNIGPAFGAYTTAGGPALQNLNAASSLGFIRCVATAAGTSPTFPLNVICVGNPQYR